MKMLDPWKARGLKMVDDLPRKPLLLADIRTKRYTTAKNGRLLPLNSEAWYRLRRMVLAEQPLCPECEARGVIEPATQVITLTTTPWTTAAPTWWVCVPHAIADTPHTTWASA